MLDAKLKKIENLYDGNRTFLLELFKKYSVKFGDFVLRSGKKSNFYIDCRPVILSPYGMVAISIVTSHRCMTEFKVTHFATTGVGGSYIACAAAMVSEGCVIHIRDSQKEHGMKGKIELPAEFDKNNNNIVVVDDVLTTGSSLTLCLDGLKDVGLKAVGCFVLVDREDGGKETIENKYGIPVSSVFKKSDF